MILICKHCFVVYIYAIVFFLFCYSCCIFRCQRQQQLSIAASTSFNSCWLPAPATTVADTSNRSMAQNQTAEWIPVLIILQYCLEICKTVQRFCFTVSRCSNIVLRLYKTVSIFAILSQDSATRESAILFRDYMYTTEPRLYKTVSRFTMSQNFTIPSRDSTVLS